jgi:ribonucleotide monophosphatase NagD (HAD superfamily)
VVYAGKPHAPIYEDALRRAASARGMDTPRGRVLAIGDSLRTDMMGAEAFGIDSLFVTNGIHAEELGTRDAPTEQQLAKIYAHHGVTPKAATRGLVW